MIELEGFLIKNEQCGMPSPLGMGLCGDAMVAPSHPVSSAEMERVFHHSTALSSSQAESGRDPSPNDVVLGWKARVTHPLGSPWAEASI